MKQRRLLPVLFTLLFTLLWAEAMATAQVPDRLVYNGDTLLIFSNPLEQLYAKDTTRPGFFGVKAPCITTACWRGYVAEWQIKNEQLYLTGIFSCCFSEDSVKADLKKLFGAKLIDGAVKADRFSGNILAPQGKRLYYVHLGYESIYEKELELQFRNGHCIGRKTYDNTKTRLSAYSQNQSVLQRFLYSNIRWNDLPRLDGREIKVFAWFSANENGIIDTVMVLRGHSPVFDQEAMRVVKAIPDWDVFYRHGKPLRNGYMLPIIFSNANKERYGR
ncbi:hypothetical protein [Dyadobacter sp. 676]|uniref:TonB C-terminal domain-containing protein n=1 Tax=Dyadobacter sp. 676 TaxID=3088362 RepID=A0AAU8FG29_9BACT